MSLRIFNTRSCALPMRVTQARCMFEATGVGRINWTVAELTRTSNGNFASASYPTSTRSIEKGDLIMLFTDGLFEVEDATGASFNEEQLRVTVSRHAALAPEKFSTKCSVTFVSIRKAKHSLTTFALLGCKFATLSNEKARPRTRTVNPNPRKTQPVI